MVFEDEEIFESFCRIFLGINLNRGFISRVYTQKTYLKLDGHDTNSRPDLVLEIDAKDISYLIFFENKVDSGEGNTQLQRYSEILESQNDKLVKKLIYLTRFYDSKKHPGLTQLRWYMIYDWLKEFDHNLYVKQVLKYMEEMGLNQMRRFLPQDIYAIQQMNRLQSMMDECLDGPVEDTMTTLFGKATGWSNRNVQLRDQSRYFKVNEQISRLLWVGYGFYLTENEYPLISIMFEVGPNYEKRKEVINAMKSFLTDYGRQNGWEDYDWDDQNSWLGISCDISLLDVLKEDDHINAIHTLFISKLKELHKMKTDFPDLG